MLSEYLGLSDLSRTIAYIVFRDGKKEGVKYEEIEKRFERFDKKAIKSSLEKLTTKEPQFLVRDGKIYHPSEDLATMFTILDLERSLQQQKAII
jgi:hypothetical protein